MKRRPTRILVAAAIRDAAGTRARPGAVAIRDGRIVAAGEAEAVLNDPSLDPAAVRGMPGMMLLPGLVNAHAHLELTAIGPRPYEPQRGFTGWLRDVMASTGELDRVASATAGAQATLAAGVCAVGDIASGQPVIDAVREAGVEGVSFMEMFGLGATSVPDLQVGGYQPHAPYSAGPALYEAAARSGKPVSTHLAETLEEHRFAAHGDGPFRELLEHLGKWKPDYEAHYQDHASSVQWMKPYLEMRSAASGGPWLLAHCNYVSDDDMKLLADTGASVAYCPIASSYFGHTGHRYREMLDAGINVCLGTDSIICQPPDEDQPLGILPQMRYLYQRDRTDPDLLLKMATVNGAKALGLPSDFATLLPGAPAHLLAVPVSAQDDTDPLKQVLREGKSVEVLHV